jgi:RNA-directed DNA polymerase
MKYNEIIVTMLFKAYFEARKHKRNKHSQLEFEIHLEENILNLYDEIVAKTYSPGTSICFIIEKPVRREIFAANFKDRIVHHFIFNIVSPLAENVFLHDVYSCRKRKGTFFGIKRASAKMQSCTSNFEKKAYLLKLDISGYFMNINKDILFQKVMRLIHKNELHLPIQSNLLEYLVRQNMYHNPTINCKFQSHKSKWAHLPKTKSLFYSSKNCGLPIGNLTSQLYGNLYLNDFDHFIKKELKIKYYGRYVDDFYLIHTNKKKLAAQIELIKRRLILIEQLVVHPKKIYFQSIYNGFPFLGVYILPYRIYIGKRIKKGIYTTLQELLEPVLFQDKIKKIEKLTSYKSILLHYNCYNYSCVIEKLEDYVLNKRL